MFGLSFPKISGFCRPTQSHPVTDRISPRPHRPRVFNINLPGLSENIIWIKSTVEAPNPDTHQCVSSQLRLPTTTMAEKSVPPPPSAVARPVSEALLNEKWDHCLSNLLVKSTLGLGFGVVFSVLLFKRRAWPAFIGVGFGAGRAYEECNSSLKQAAREIRKQA